MLGYCRDKALKQFQCFLWCITVSTKLKKIHKTIHYFCNMYWGQYFNFNPSVILDLIDRLSTWFNIVH